MAPFCSDPRQIVIALEPRRRIELLKLVDDIIFSMTAQLQSKPEELGSVSVESSIHGGSGTPQNEKTFDSPSPTGDANKTETSSESITLFDAEDTEFGNAAPANGSKKKFSPSNPFKNVKVGVPWKNNPSAPSKTTKRAEEVQSAARQYMEEWEHEFVPKLEEIVRVKDNDKITAERKIRRQAVQMNEENERAESKRRAGSDEARDEEAAFAVMQTLYPPIPTSLTELSVHDRREAISCVLLLLLSTGKYSAHSRALMLTLTSSLDIPHAFLNNEEAAIAESLIEQSTADKGKKEAMSADAEAAKRQQDNKFGRYWKVGLASVAGATLIGVTGGLAAPLVAGAVGSILGGVGLGGVASFLGIFWMNGALVGALFGAYGAKMTGSMMDKYAKEVEDFKFIPLHEPPEATDRTPSAKGRRLRVTLGINGWLNSEDDITKPWEALPADSEVFALRYEMQTLLALGTALGDLVQSFAWKAVKAEIIKRTVLATLWAALWPIQVFAVASNVDNPFNHASNRSKKAGRLLADALINRVQGERPVTLIGYSLGAAAIHACLQELAARRAFGLIDTVVLMGAPAPSDPAHWRTLRAVVSGAIFNAYSENDMILGYVHRMHSLSLGVAGLQPIRGVAGVENLDLSDRVSGHLRYPHLIGGILRRCGFAGVRVDEPIEKDDVILLKDEYAAGHAVNVDGTTIAPAGDEKAGDAKGDVEKVASQTERLQLGIKEQEVLPPPPPRPSHKAGEEEPPKMRRKPVPAPSPSKSQDDDDAKPISMMDLE
ncbi:YSIRK family gram-positive signal peptide [Beauveria bassiana ARSEF 2860]|uniref:YSIRK family gram-positive signal peptide n=1 Tax=Beauveria bassiana (strain ARSEF 2860) TaxID=655819 RepID=J4KRA9_BEAB2|nr:YSIRK family gram-positive signal peptide [Beauveria bassiana ARSEF 2860]EJP70634.1 YSIRK family gram-positive signal peptide [Beauveria bassiana ARSEF 2860]